MSEETPMPTGDEQPIPTGESSGPPPEMRTEDAMRFALGLFADLAWIQLGIRANPANGETKADLAQARLSIDVLAALTQLAEGRFDPHEVRDFKNLVSSLQLNYVQRMSAAQ